MKKLCALLLTLIFIVGLISPSITATAYATEGGKPIVMSVRAGGYSEEIYKEFDNFEDGWVYICETASTYYDDFDVKLYADWIAPDGRFYYTDEDGDETGTDDGRLYFDVSRFEEGGHTNYNKINIDFKEGLNVVPQMDKAFMLTNGDKVLLWYNMIDLVPGCEPLTIK